MTKNGNDWALSPGVEVSSASRPMALVIHGRRRAADCWRVRLTGWRPVSGGPAQVGLVAAPGTNWWVAGLNGGLASTYNNGRTWWEPFIDGIDEPLTCIAASPRWATDRIMLAGTAGAGIIKTIDGGRRWLGTNFGLQDYTVLALAPATDWSRREIMFAGTLDGVYRSSGGGRAWKHVGLGWSAHSGVGGEYGFC